MSIGFESVLEYAHSIPGLAKYDCLFSALHGGSHQRALERCDRLLSEHSNVPTGVRQQRMLRRLRTMIKLLSSTAPVG